MMTDSKQKILELIRKEFDEDAVHCAVATAIFEQMPTTREELIIMMSSCMLGFISMNVVTERLIIKRKEVL